MSTKKASRGAVAVDCEMVGGRRGKKRREKNLLARVSLVDEQGVTIYDTYVSHAYDVRVQITDYRTAVSGVTEAHIATGKPFHQVLKEVAKLIKKRILVGHALDKDLNVLQLNHPQWNQRDTANYPPFQTITKSSTPSLKGLAKEVLGINIQHGEHSSVEDARATMQLYCTVAKNWNADIEMPTKKKPKKKSTKKEDKK